MRLKRSRLRPSSSIVDADISHAVTCCRSRHRLLVVSPQPRLDTRHSRPSSRVAGCRPGRRPWCRDSRSPRPRPRAQAFDTASGLVVGVGPASGPVRMYVCGITPYDATHLGHANTYVAFDLLNRIWRDAGLAVEYVQNVTDVDDPLLERAAQTGVDWEQLARGADRAVHRGHGGPERPPAGALRRCRRIGGPGHRSDRAPAGPGRGRIRSTIRSSRDLYFAQSSDPAFGSLAKLDEAEAVRLFAERGGDPDRPGKKHPLDCLLWRQQRAGEPGWESPVRARASRLARRVHRTGPAAARQPPSTCRAAAGT